MIPFCTFHDELTNNNNIMIMKKKTNKRNINDGEDKEVR